jgi:TetR/AcrR family transcriptional regulator, transcriptional repressor for nem operon
LNLRQPVGDCPLNSFSVPFGSKLGGRRLIRAGDVKIGLGTNRYKTQARESKVNWLWWPAAGEKMARPREFDPEVAMDKAMGLFWDVGYEEASLADLLSEMGITKGSFYKAFRDKHSVYLSALDHYNDKVIGSTVAYLADQNQGSGKERILGLFAVVADRAKRDGNRLGCFLCNALVDKAAEGGEAEKKLQAMVRRLENAFYKAVIENPSVNETGARETARGVLSAYFGLHVLGRAGLSSDMAEDCISQLKLLLDR